MSQKRIICCEVCGLEYQETAPGAGFPGWGALHGVSFNGVQNPELCPAHLAEAAEFLYRLRDKENRT